MAFQRVERESLSRKVSSQLEDAIVSGDLDPDSRLPSEQELAGQLGVSRNVVREALRSLEERGLITIRTGSGAYVSHPRAEVVRDALGRYIRQVGLDESISDVYEMRRAIEGTVVRLATERVTDADLRALTTLFQEMEAGQEDPTEWMEADLAFHQALAEATHNPLFGILLGSFTDLFKDLILTGYYFQPSIEVGLEHHRLILQALQARDAKAAFEAMMDHLGESERRVIEMRSKE